VSTDTTADDATPRKPVHVDDEAALDALLDEHELVLVDFYTRGCSICQSIEPVLGNVARAHDDLVVAMVNPREDPPLIDRFTVKSVPTLILFEDGEAIGRLAEGFQGGDAITSFIEETRSD
jgi:thioredoxin-like negative regulator of GroEL